MVKLDTVFFSDEAWAHLDGYVNTPNYHVRRRKNPHDYVEMDELTYAHKKHDMVCCTTYELLDHFSLRKP